MSQYSFTDPSLPYGQSTESVGTYRQPTPRKTITWSESRCDLYETRQRVIRVYRDQVVNGFPLIPYNQ